MCTQSGVDADMFGLEVYPFNGSPAFFYTYIKQLASLGKPVFIHETGYPSVKPSADESWLNSLEWHTFDEKTQALWFKYIFTIAFDMKEVTGVSLLNLRDAPPGNPYSTTVSSLFDNVGVLTVTMQPKESFNVLSSLMANFTTSGQALTDENGIINLRGFAGKYSMNVSGYNPISNVIHVSEGKTDRVTVKVVRTGTAGSTSAVTVATSQFASTSQLQATALTGYFTYAILGIIVVLVIIGVVVIRKTRRKEIATIS